MVAVAIAMRDRIDVDVWRTRGRDNYNAQAHKKCGLVEPFGKSWVPVFMERIMILIMKGPKRGHH